MTVQSGIFRKVYVMPLAPSDASVAFGPIARSIGKDAVRIFQGHTARSTTTTEATLHPKHHSQEIEPDGIHQPR